MIVKFGLDVHAAQITVCRQIEDQLPQPAHKMSWPRCLEWLEAHAKAGATVHSCYEAGPFGYHLHRTLEQLGIKNLVIAPQRWDERGQRVKTDKRDARELCNRLDRYVRGNTAVFSVVRVPTPQQERERSLARQRVALIKERQRCALRGHSLTLAQGIRAPEGWWQPEAWREFAPALPRWLRERLQWWQEQAVRHDAQAAEVTARIEALATNTPVPKGVGTLTATLLRLELLDWSRFKNRRQVSSYTGLCPGEASSGERRCQGSINKCGHPRVRHLLIEAAWRLPYWQPDYGPVRKLRAAQGVRSRKRMVVALARRLAVDLWRIHTGQCSAAKLGLRLQSS